MASAVAEIRRAYPDHKRRFNAQYLWWHRVMETPALYLAGVALRLGFSANQVTVISLVIALAACATIAFGDWRGRLAGLALVVVWQWLDDVDGHLARTRRQGSPLGAFLDETGAHLMYLGLFFSLGVSLALYPEPAAHGWMKRLAGSHADAAMLAIGAFAGAATLLRTVLAGLYQQLAPAVSPATSGAPTTVGPSSGISALYRWYHLNVLELPGFVIPALAIATAFQAVSGLTIVFALCWALDVLVVFGVHARRLASAPKGASI